MSTGGAPPHRPRIVVAGGHSVGHIEPAMNLADAILATAPSAEITALGTARGLDTVIIPARGHTLELIPPVPLPRKVDRELLRVPRRLLAAVRAAGAVLDSADAEAVAGFGGYVAMPAYLAARRRGLPIVAHEANAVPGVANRVAARLTRHVFTASPAVPLTHATPIGIPLRPGFATLDRAALRAEARHRFGLRAQGPVLLATGGSQGAESINGAVRGAADRLTAAGVQVLHIAGPGRTVEPPHGGPSYRVLPFVEEMRYAYAAADLAICRSGAMTCAELAAVGLPAAFVPLPLRGGEQRRNAEPLVAAGGALLVGDADLTPAWIARNLLPLLTDPVALAAMSSRLAAAGSPDAAGTLARHVLRLIAERRATAR
ncbi:glycosyltransferase [Tsukamurella sp. 1534]|uniref:UDP-N-acetylglucosamine--N-acetylmuramyl- (pentapeptide) pyrophosphoryl-undecaprenol N-acetylglucosamine transferase n=1 Tax=Tsukamurella sp. 1534 TaxID=1151061 RepID=UPI0005925622|nr:UDP-N-acetylglucosamine--N-acetylmuramyl-(pentapeptide) pyrophosphoryl-undecaprenol N-acetylglucosamine transferase [Tsukamurella sp. 1534]